MATAFPQPSVTAMRETRDESPIEREETTWHAGAIVCANCGFVLAAHKGLRHVCPMQRSSGMPLSPAPRAPETETHE